MSVLLREYNDLPYSGEVVQEAKSLDKPVIVKALLQRADAVNQNKRIYPRRVLEREIEKYMEAVDDGRSTGELDHPDDSVVSLGNVSHIIRKVWWKGDEVWGDVEILNTPPGKVVKELMASGVKIGISSRGVGEVDEDDDGNDVVGDDFILIGFDLVSEPSTQGAWLMKESKQLCREDICRLVPKTYRVRRLVDAILS